MGRNRDASLDQFSTFGELLRYLRRRAGLTQREISIAVGYSDAQISRIEKNQRVPDPATVAALFVPALQIQDEPDIVARLMQLADVTRGKVGRDPRGRTSTADNYEAANWNAQGKVAEPQLGNLPHPLTSFVGRTHEVAAIHQRLRPQGGVRLLTLTGIGGTGKTRLAMQAAAGLRDLFPQGVWFVDLAPSAEPALVPLAIVTSLGLREEAGRPAIATVIDYLQSATALLILDNCEQVVEACALAVDMVLRSCLQVHCLATSRETLGVAGELTFPVPPLAIPQPEAASEHELESLVDYEAVRLFVERAQTALPDFRLTAETASAVVQICQQLDGIPLAIELAAARVQMLQVEQIVVRLQDRLRLLTGGTRTALPRHQTLRACLDWSYVLLSEAEQTLLRRLSVFAGGWTLDAAERVGSGAGIESAEVLDLLTQLVHKSMVVVDRGQGQAPRYRLLDIVRQYGQEKLALSEETQSVCDRHLAYFLWLAEAAEPELYGRDQGAWLRRLETEDANLEAALSWALDGDAARREVGLRLASMLGWSWDLRARPSRGSRWLEEFLSSLPEATPGEHPHSTLARAKAMAYLAWLMRPAMLNQDRALTLALESIRLCQALGPAANTVHAFALAVLGLNAFYRADHAQSVRRFTDALALSRAVGAQWHTRLMLIGLAETATAQGELVRSAELIEESMAIARALGDRKGIATCLQSLGEIAVAKGQDAEADALYRESLSHANDVAGRLMGIYAIDALGDIALRRGDYEQAGSLYGQSLAGYRAMGTRIGLARTFARQARLAVALGQLERASKLYRESLELFSDAGERHEVLLALAGLARLVVELGQVERAWRLLGAAEHLRASIGGLKWPTFRIEYERMVRETRAILRAPSPVPAWNEGQSMDWKQAMSYALDNY